MKQYHESCHAYRVSLFSVIAFTAIGPTSSTSRTALVIVSRKALTKINGHTFVSTGPCLRTPHKQMSRDYPILVERHGLCFCLWICFSPPEMSSIFRQDCAEMLNESTAQNMHQHTGSLPFWQQVMLHPTSLLLQCGRALSAPQYCIYCMNGIAPFQVNKAVHLLQIYTTQHRLHHVKTYCSGQSFFQRIHHVQVILAFVLTYF